VHLDQLWSLVSLLVRWLGHVLLLLLVILVLLLLLALTPLILLLLVSSVLSIQIWVVINNEVGILVLLVPLSSDFLNLFQCWNWIEVAHVVLPSAVVWPVVPLIGVVFLLHFIIIIF
jgi:hypothetical protein